MNFWNAPISVPYGNKDYDVAMGGSHDMDYNVPVGTPIPALYSGKVVDVSAPEWGKQVGIQFDKSPNGVPYYSYVHLDAVNPTIAIGQHVEAGQIIGWSGGENDITGVASNPTGTHFSNPSYQSSQPQVGLAMMYGPVYGSGPGWVSQPETHPELNPLQLTGGAPIVLGSGFEIPGLNLTIPPSFWSQMAVGGIGIVVMIIAGIMIAFSFKSDVISSVKRRIL